MQPQIRTRDEHARPRNDAVHDVNPSRELYELREAAPECSPKPRHDAYSEDDPDCRGKGSEQPKAEQ